MKLQAKILMVLVAQCLALGVSAQTADDAVVALNTDRITYSYQGGQYYENLWKNDEIYRSRPLSAGTPLVIDWEIPQNGAIFAQGVTLTSGWYDVNKKEDGRTGNDAVMCWAAVCANMLEWWQDRYVEKYGALPSNAVSGAGKEYELALFELYQRDWKNDHGSEVYYGIPWYLTGEDRTANAMYVAKPIREGGYFAAEWAQLGIPDQYVYEVSGYSTWDDGWGVDTSRDAIDIFTEYVVDAINRGMASLSIRVGYSNMHAITLWGYELDEKGRVKTIYVTDSDDLISKPKEPRVQLMQKYAVEVRNGREVGIVGAYDGFNMISQIVPFHGNLK